jgi:L-asparaginase II
VELAARMLDRIGLSADALACGAHMPFNDAAAAALRSAGAEPTRLHNNCSGKHAGMLALAVHHGWPVDGYHEAGHPVQQRMRAEIAAWSDMPAEALATGVDGCGVVTFGLPLHALARTFAALAVAAHRDEGAAGRLVHAMLRHPELVAGTDRLCTALMSTGGGRVFAKVGAEGVYCAGIPERGLGIAIKVQDGAQRAAEPALLSVLQQLGALADEDIEVLQRWSRPELRNTRGAVVGRLESCIQLEEVA